MSLLAQGARITDEVRRSLFKEVNDNEDKDLNGDLNPPEFSRSYSSVWDNSAIGTGWARSMLSSDSAWCAQHNNQDQWMVIDTGNQTLAVGVIVQGPRLVPGIGCGEKVTRVAVSVGNAQDGPWTECGEYDCHTSNEHEQRRVMLNQPTAGRYVRLNPRSWEQHISMRAGVIITGISLLEQLMLDSKCAKLVEALSSDPAIKEAASGDVITNLPGTGAITTQPGTGAITTQPGTPTQGAGAGSKRLALQITCMQQTSAHVRNWRRRLN